MTMYPLTVLVFVILSTQVNGIQFSFIPSPNITILQSAVYQCMVTDVDSNDAVFVVWNVNDVSSSSSSWEPYLQSTGITAVGVGSQNSVVTVPGNATLNETKVKCIASGVVNNNGYWMASTAILYIQGIPSSVQLNCSKSSVYTIQCNWSIPYTVFGITIDHYIINITLIGEDSQLVLGTTLTDTMMEYNVSEFGEYNISVAAVIDGELEGVTDTVQVQIDEAVPIEESSSVYTNQFTYQIDTASTGQISTTFTNFVVTSSYSASIYSSKDIFETSIATTPNDIVITTSHSISLHNSNNIIETSIVVTTLNQPNITKPQIIIVIGAIVLCLLTISLTALMALVMLYVKKNHRKEIFEDTMVATTSCKTDKATSENIVVDQNHCYETLTRFNSYSADPCHMTTRHVTVKDNPCYELLPLKEH